MTIYNIVDGKKKEEIIVEAPKVISDVPFSPSEPLEKEQFFSSLVARLFFLLLFIADIGWFFYSCARMCFWSVLWGVTFGKSFVVKGKLSHSICSLKRSLICSVALFIALFSPSLGIMIACTYFLMYDPTGIEEVVPKSLQEQFKEFFK